MIEDKGAQLAGLQSALFTTKNELAACLEASKTIQAREWELQARVQELEADKKKIIRWANTSLDSVKDRMWKLEGAIREIVKANETFLEAIPHMRDEGDPLVVAIDKAWKALTDDK